VNTLLVLAAAGGVLLLDQCSKCIVRVHAGERPVSLGPLLRIRNVRTTRVSFARRHGRLRLVLVWLAALIAAIVLSRTVAGFGSAPALWGLGAALGGAAGNLLDVLRRRAVTDFIELGWWPVFNLADVGIVAGLALAFWSAL
jgi:signal peptidase II